MTQPKGIIFIILFVTALIIVGRILYYQQLVTTKAPIKDSLSTLSEVIPPSPSSTVPGTSQQQPSMSASEIVREYTKENALKKLALTRDNIIWYTNYERVKNNREPLSTNQQLMNSASEKNADMITHQYFNHSRNTVPPVGFDVFIDNQNYEFIKIGENLAKGDFSTSAEVVAAWMKSPSHRRNILDPTYHDIGVHIKNGEIDGRRVTLITQHFGDPRSSCPSVNAASKQAIDTLRERISELQQSINEEQKQVTQTTSFIDPHYEVYVANYNRLIAVYNQSIRTIDELVEDYNTQVRKYDQCIAGRR